MSFWGQDISLRVTSEHGRPLPLSIFGVFLCHNPASPQEGAAGGDQTISLDMREGRRSFETKVEYDDDDDRLIRTQTALNATPMCSKLQLTVISKGP